MGHVFGMGKNVPSQPKWGCFLILVSRGTFLHTCIFPQSSIAFMVIPTSEVLTNWPPVEPCQIDQQLVQNLTKFSKLHYKSYVLLCAPLLGTSEQKVISALQQRFLTHSLHFLPVHNATECVECMTSIAKVTCKPLSSVIRERMDRVQEQLLSEETVLSIISQCGLSKHESLFLLDGCSSLACIARASLDDLMECSLDHATAEGVQRFLHSGQ